jgi:disulfide bond formation protein DsbB
MFDLSTMKLFFAMLALATNVVVVGYVVMVAMSPFSAKATDLLERFYNMVDGQELLYAALVAGSATIGSLYLSEIADLTPCRLCWWQRYVMYPLAVVLAVAAWRRYVKVRVPVAVASLLGAGISLYHYLVQWFPDLEGNACSATVPCFAHWFRVFGFISIPYMALSAFLFVFVMMMALRSNEQRHPATASTG